MVHEGCVLVPTKTWVDKIDGEHVVFSVDSIICGLKCSACMRMQLKVHGVLIQCAKSKFPKVFHITCAQ
ncbi:hypothetical protein DFH08DRAFT_669675, partial [Mycena albidolilacea]